MTDQDLKAWTTPAVVDCDWAMDDIAVGLGGPVNDGAFITNTFATS